ncbi:MAG: sigma-54 dependent transcriptional regulator [Lentisphaerales bacterium]|nr:sigma-54 dependent transcriptional regulator [Lentisphaerales bacterium]
MLDNKKIMVIDDEPAVAGLVGEIVKEFNIEPLLVFDPKLALSEFNKHEPFLIFSDLTMPGMSGIEVLARIREKSTTVNYVIMTGYGSIESAIDAIKLGASEYIQKPLNLDFIRHTIKKSLENDALIRENAELKEKLQDQKFPQIIGKSLGLTRLLDIIKKVASSQTDVMVCGESGTGKEMIARSVHNLSPRNDKPFVAVDCVALPRTLFESEMFGYEKGAFTGADNRKDGLLQQAQGGTLFIDEVTELDYDLQAKLLRVLQERKFRRVGGSELIDLDIRIVSATRRNPLEEVEKGTFRDDLYYRLSVIPLEVPALRERREDIPLLVHNFITQSAEKNSMDSKKVSPEVMNVLERYNWPGNIRELKNVVERLLILSGDTIELQDLPMNLKPGSDSNLNNLADINLVYKEAKEQVLHNFTNSYLQKLYLEQKGNISNIARKSKLSRKALYDLIKKFNIKFN